MLEGIGQVVLEVIVVVDVVFADDVADEVVVALDVVLHRIQIAVGGGDDVGRVVIGRLIKRGDEIVGEGGERIFQ